MSLLQSEEFALYQLRTAYLSHIKDGVGERLINVNTAVLNNPAFRDAGWVPNTAEIKRTYSPPIPTTAISSEYFQVPPRSAGLPGPGLEEDEDIGGMVTGQGGSNDTVGPSLAARTKRRKQHQDEDDSSDLSDDSDEELEGDARPSQKIKFQKMPLRTRAGSSPLQNTHRPDEPSVMITSPSQKPEAGFRRGSVGAVEEARRRRRADTITSSEMSSENELDPLLFKRKPVSSSRAAKASRLLAEQIDEDEGEMTGDAKDATEDEAGDSDLSSDLEGSLDSNSLLEEAGGGLASSPLLEPPLIPPAITPQQSSPRKTKQATVGLQALPPPRPISTIQPASALTMAIKARNKKPANPVDRFAALSGKGDPNPLYIKIYAPFSEDSEDAFEVLLRRSSPEGVAVTVAEVIGFSMWRYAEEGRKPPIEGDKLNVNRWVLRMVDDGEVEYDFEAPSRIKSITDFTSNNNRGARPRARDKPWDEFAIVEANPTEIKENERLTPDFSEEATAAAAIAEDTPSNVPSQPEAPRKISEPPQPLPASFGKSLNPITGPSFAPSALRKESIANRLDAPAQPASKATPRTGATKRLNVHFLDNNLNAHNVTIDTTTDTYIAEVFDQACKKLNVDKALYILRVSRTNTIALSDRTIEALGNRISLDLTRRRFVGEADFGLSGSPGSSSPNAPLLLTSGGTPVKGGKRKVNSAIHPLAQKSDIVGLANPAAAVQSNYKRYNVVRKQPMSFTPSHPRVLLLDGEFMHIMPSETGGGGVGGGGAGLAANTAGKITTVGISNIVGCKVSRKHPKTVRVLVFRERETKRYDFEAANPSEAQEIVAEIRKGIEPYYTRAEDLKI
ncbi:MAG: hypothetical protein M1820_004776 [Bogoriella megaspora]|nr:MAG: hypothetical protein M1820_004776 [Bogoriella megaspora]